MTYISELIPFPLDDLKYLTFKIRNNLLLKPSNFKDKHAVVYSDYVL